MPVLHLGLKASFLGSLATGGFSKQRKICGKNINQPKRAKSSSPAKSCFVLAASDRGKPFAQF